MAEINKKEETKGQEEMDETGADLDKRQQDQLDEFMGNFQGSTPKASDEDEGEEKDDSSDDTSTDDDEDEGDDDDSTQGDEEDKEDSESSEDDEDEDEGEEDEKDEVETLRIQVAEMEGLLKDLVEGKKGDSDDGEVISEELSLPKVTIDAAALVSEELAEELGVPKEALVKLVSLIYTKAREDSLRDVPELIKVAHLRTSQLTDAQNKFWKEFPDLAEVVKENEAVLSFLQTTANQIQSNNPTWGVLKVYREAGKKVSQVVSVTEKARKIEKKTLKSKGKKKRSNQPSKPRGKRSAPGGDDDRSELLKDIDQMINAVG